MTISGLVVLESVQQRDRSGRPLAAGEERAGRWRGEEEAHCSLGILMVSDTRETTALEAPILLLLLLFLLFLVFFFK